MHIGTEYDKKDSHAKSVTSAAAILGRSGLVKSGANAARRNGLIGGDPKGGGGARVIRAELWSTGSLTTNAPG